MCLILRGLGAVTGKIKLALAAGKANPAPPVGPALGSKVGQLPGVPAASPACAPHAGQGQRTAHAHGTQGVNIMAFCKEYNAQTAKMIGDIIPVEITVYEVRTATPQLAKGTDLVTISVRMLKSTYVTPQDRSFTFILKTPPASILLKKAAGGCPVRKWNSSAVRATELISRFRGPSGGGEGRGEQKGGSETL